MKNNLKLFIFILFLCLFIPRLNAEEEPLFLDSEVTISMDFQDANLKDILKIFSIQSGLNFVASEAVQERKITLYLDNVPLKEAMDNIFKANNLYYELDKTANIFIVKDLGAPQIETITKVYHINYRSVPSANLEKEKNSLLKTGGGEANIVTSIKQVLSSNGKIAEDISTNSLIITDIPSRFPEIERVIAGLDVIQSQIMLEVEILDVSKSTVDKLGFEFGNNPLTLIMPGGYNRIGNTFYIGAASDRNKEGGLTLGRTYAHLLDFLRTQTDTKYLARPRLLTLNNETAEISITSDEIVGYNETTSLTSTGQPVTTREYIRATALKLTPEGAGVILRVTPQINPETNDITMVINPKSSTTKSSTISGGTQADSELRTTKSIVRVHDGETVILGGLIHNDKNIVLKKLPLLGDIPVIGALFRHKDLTKDIERELLVFITPRIVKDTYKEATPAKKVALPEREQNAGSIADRQVAISSSLDSFEK